MLRHMARQDPTYKAAMMGLQPLKIAQASSIGITEYRRHTDSISKLNESELIKIPSISERIKHHILPKDFAAYASNPHGMIKALSSQSNAMKNLSLL
jgi:hypothetical protein